MPVFEILAVEVTVVNSTFAKVVPNTMQIICAINYIIFKILFKRLISCSNVFLEFISGIFTALKSLADARRVPLYYNTG